MLSKWKPLLAAMTLSLALLLVCGLFLYNKGAKVMHERFAEREKLFDAQVAPLYEEVEGLKQGDDLTTLVEKFPRGRSGASVSVDKVTISVPRVLTTEGGMVFVIGTIFEVEHQNMHFVSLVKKRAYTSTSLGDDKPPTMMQLIRLGWGSIF